MYRISFDLDRSGFVNLSIPIRTTDQTCLHISQIKKKCRSEMMVCE